MTMDKEMIIRQLVKRDFNDNWYLIGFFSVLIVLVLFVIRPNVNEFLRRQKLYDDLSNTNIQYDSAISNLKVLQTLFERYRDQFVLLDEAVPERLNVYDVSKDVSEVFLPFLPGQAIEFPGYEIGEMANASGPTKDSKLIPYKLTMQIQGTYSELQDVLSSLMTQRRLKRVTRVVFTRNQTASGSAELGMQVDFEAYHLQ